MYILSHRQVVGGPSKPLQNMAQYSSDGQSLALQSKEAYDRSRGDWDQASRAASLGLKQIRAKDSTTSTEKDLANFGFRLSGYSNADKATIARMQRSVLGSIAAAVPGPTGQVLAQAGLQVIGYGATDLKSGRTAAREALRMIVASPQTDGREKDLAVLGIELGEDRMLNGEALAMRRTILGSLAKGIEPAPMPQILAKATAQATVLNSFSTWTAVNSATVRGLQEIHNHPDSTSRDRTIAQMGIQLGEGTNERQSVQIRQAFLGQLVHSDHSNASSAIAKAAASVAGYRLGRAVTRKVMESVFAEVLRNPDSTPRQKDFARQGLFKADEDPLYADSRRLQFMQYIAQAK